MIWTFVHEKVVFSLLSVFQINSSTTNEWKWMEFYKSSFMRLSSFFNNNTKMILTSFLLLDLETSNNFNKICLVIALIEFFLINSYAELQLAIELQFIFSQGYFAFVTSAFFFLLKVASSNELFNEFLPTWTSTWPKFIQFYSKKRVMIFGRSIEIQQLQNGFPKFTDYPFLFSISFQWRNSVD